MKDPRIHDGAWKSPFPNNLEDAFDEIARLRSMLIRGRKQWSETAVELDRLKKEAQKEVEIKI